MGFAVSADHRGKIKESEKTDGYFGLFQKTEKSEEHKIMDNGNCCKWGLGRSPRAWRRDWRNWKSAGESKPPRLQHCWGWLEYWEVSWRIEETCYHSKFSESSLDNADMKSSQGVGLWVKTRWIIVGNRKWNWKLNNKNNNNNLHSVIRYQVLLCNTNNFTQLQIFQSYTII